MKNLIKRLSFFFLLNLLIGIHSAYALPFSVTPQGALPTRIIAGQSVTANYTVINNTSKTAPGSFVKYLPPNVQVNPSPGSCGNVFSLQPFGTSGDRCNLQLNVTGAVNGDDPDPYHHLFICRTGGIVCAGTLFPLNVRSVGLVSITLSPLNPTINAGNTQQFSAVGHYSDGLDSDITSSVTWTSSNTAVATINNTGLATGSASGTTTIAATLGGISAATQLTVTSSSSAGLAVAVGESFLDFKTLIGQTVNGGNSWSRVPLTIGGYLASASCTGSGSSAICAAVGHDGGPPLIVQTLNGGQSWNQVSQPVFNDAYLTSVSCTGIITVNCVAAGYENGLTTQPLLFQTNNSGITWNQVTVIGAPINGLFNAASCSLDNSLPRICIAAGRDTDISPSPALLAQSIDNGNTWSKVDITGLSLIEDSSFVGASCIGSGPSARCMAVGANDTNFTALLAQSLDGGTTWNVFDILGTPGSSYFTNISCIGSGNTAHCVAVGAISGGATLLLAQSADGGGSWGFVDLSSITSTGFLQNVSCIETGATNFCIAVGTDSATSPHENLLIQSINGGTWTRVILPGIVGGGDFEGASCTNVSGQAFCIASGTDGDRFPVIAQTTNSGTSWQVLPQNTFGTIGGFFGAGSSASNLYPTKKFGIKNALKLKY